MNTDLGFTIRKYRELKGFTQQQMADFLGMAVSNYNKIENNKLELTVVRMMEIVKILKININVLLEVENEQSVQLIVNDNNGVVTGNYNTNYFTEKLNEIIHSKDKI